MNITAIISEYNPLHKGHLYHIETARKETNADFIIAIMTSHNLGILSKIKSIVISDDNIIYPK